MLYFLLNGDGFSGRKIRNRLLENVMMAQKCPKVQTVKNEGNECQRGSGSDFLVGMEDAPFGIPMYRQREGTGLCRGQQCSFRDRLGGFVQFDPLDGLNVPVNSTQVTKARCAHT